MTNPAAHPPAAILEWDSAFFRRRIAQAGTHTLDETGAAALLAWCRQQQIDCLYLLAEANDAETVRQAERRGFNLVDVRVTLATAWEARPPVQSPAELCVDAAQASDLDRLRAIARSSHQDSRFYYDAHFDRGECDRLYETWIEKSCQGYADGVLVARMAEGAAGYVTCHLIEQGRGKIGLVGVDPAARGRQVGQALVAAALDWFGQQGAQQVSVVTQGRNVAAQRLYARCGFLPQQLQLWYHRWFELASHGEA